MIQHLETELPLHSSSDSDQRGLRPQIRVEVFVNCCIRKKWRFTALDGTPVDLALLYNDFIFDRLQVVEKCLRF
jgi:hypothetical protein